MLLVLDPFLLIGSTLVQSFNFGVFYVTPFTYRSFMFQCKSKNVSQKWVPATMIGPTIIQHSRHLQNELENTSDMFIITDGEPALIAAILNFFKKCTLLRCTRHFENNCKDYLKQVWICGSMEDVMLDVVFSEMD